MTREEAIEVIKAKADYLESDKRFRAAVETIIPELKESEDERIRRALIEYFRPGVQLDFIRGVPIQKIRDWLEKQKEVELTEEDKKIIPEALVMLCNDIINHRVHTPIRTDEEGARKIKTFLKTINRQPHKTKEEWEKQKEQKPAEWSEEDERMLSRCVKSIESSKQFADSDTFKKAKDNEIDWLKNRFKFLHPQAKVEWSEEDEKRVKQLIYDTEAIRAGYEKRKESLGDDFNDIVCLSVFLDLAMIGMLIVFAYHLGKMNNSKK